MAMVNPVVLQVVGYQNSGKTTFIHSLIERLSIQNMKVGTIKHHGHGGKPEVNEKKDSAMHIQSGAQVSLVEGDGRLLFQAEKPTWSLEEQINIMKTFQLDVLIIEGHKYEDYPKVVIIKDENDLHLLKDLSNIKVVLYQEENLDEKVNQGYSGPNFPSSSPEGLDWIINYINDIKN
jgi:molybdopterin-guanine dinucleotide biosynthesis adapter protein